MDIAKISNFFWILFEGREYAFALINKYERVGEGDYLNFKVVRPVPENVFVIIPVVRIAQKVVMLEFTNVLHSFQSRVTLALINYK